MNLISMIGFIIGFFILLFWVFYVIKSINKDSEEREVEFQKEQQYWKEYNQMLKNRLKLTLQLELKSLKQKGLLTESLETWFNKQIIDLKVWKLSLKKYAEQLAELIKNKKELIVTESNLNPLFLEDLCGKLGLRKEQEEIWSEAKKVIEEEIKKEIYQSY